MVFSDFLKKENNNLDLIRIICASMVIIGHSYKLNPPDGHQDLIESLTGFTYSGTLAVQIFFFISGMLVTHSLLSKGSVISFTISRFFRLVPGLLFLLLVSVLLVGPLLTDMSASAYFSNTDTYRYITNNLLYRDYYNLPGIFVNNFRPFTVNGSLWSLSYEVACYMALLGLFCLVGRSRLLANLLILAIFVDTAFRFNLLFGWMSGDHPDARLLPLAFASGALLAVNSDYIKINFKLPLGFALLTFVFWKSGMNEIFFMLTSCFIMISVSIIPAIRSISIRYDISYGIYLWGFFVQQILNRYLGPVHVYLFMFYSLYIASLMGFISYLLVEKRFIRYGKIVDANILASEIS